MIARRIPPPAVVLAVAATLTLTACLAEQASPGSRELAPGFWRGLWHGIIAPLGFVVGLFSDHVRIYAIPNAGRWYDFGFMIGIGGFTHGVAHGARHRRKPRRPSDE